GISWETIRTSFAPSVALSLAFADRYFVATGLNANEFYFSRDLRTWTASRLGNDNILGSAAYGKEFWLCGERSTIWKVSWTLDPIITVSPNFWKDGYLSLTLSVSRASSNSFEAPFEVGTYELQASQSLTNPLWRPIATLNNLPMGVHYVETT